LQKLFAVATGLPVLTPLLKWLTRLPPNPVFQAIFRTYYFVTHQTEIFRHRTTASDWWSNLRHITQEA
jgi:hypothetical protein